MSDDLSENPFEGIDVVDYGRLFALRTCCEYLTGHLVGRIPLTSLLAGARISRYAYNNLWRAKDPSPTIAAAIYRYIHSWLQEKDPLSPCVPWMRPTFRCLFPMLTQFEETPNAFIDCADQMDERHYNAYVGTYGAFRYAAHLNVEPEPPAPKGTPVDLEAARDRIDARIVRAALSISRPRSSQCDYVYLVGVEENMKSPMVVATSRRRVAVNLLEGMVMRKHERGYILTSKVIFVKRPRSKSFDEECSQIGIFRESELESEISGFKRLMYNDVRQYGKGNLLL